jgi:hypothetical protein
MPRILLEPLPTGDGRIMLRARPDSLRERVRRLLRALAR